MNRTFFIECDGTRYVLWNKETIENTDKFIELITSNWDALSEGDLTFILKNPEVPDDLKVEVEYIRNVLKLYGDKTTNTNSYIYLSWCDRTNQFVTSTEILNKIECIEGGDISGTKDNSQTR